MANIFRKSISTLVLMKAVFLFVASGYFILFIPCQLAAGNKKNEDSKGNILWPP